MNGKKLNFLLVKPAGPDCNMACTYCFYYHKADLFGEAKRHLMNKETLEITTKQMLASADRPVTIAWQGGEPTLAGYSFFERAVALQEKYNCGFEVGNAFQTNGYLLNHKWSRFFKRHNFLVGLSLDGPEHVHDRYRMLADGRGSWRKVTDNLKILLDHGVAVNAMTVVNDYSVNFPEEIYAFHKEMGLVYMQFLPCVETDPADITSAAPFSVTAAAYGEFLCKLFDLWTADFHDGIPQTSIRFFDSVMLSYMEQPPEECTFFDECGAYLVVEHNGDLYPCDFFVEPRLRLGNVHQDNMLEILNSVRQRNFGKNKVSVPENCRKCPWLKHCKGGCLKDRVRDPRDEGRNHFCRAQQIFFSYADNKLKELAAHFTAVLAAGRGGGR
ncbi:MAG: anaerobic sulfatase maturase [Dethiobacteria bacterium]